MSRSFPKKPQVNWKKCFADLEGIFPKVESALKNSSSELHPELLSEIGLENYPPHIFVVINRTLLDILGKKNEKSLAEKVGEVANEFNLVARLGRYSWFYGKKKVRFRYSGDSYILTPEYLRYKQ